MSQFSVRLFTALQQASFYYSVHEEAVALLPEGNGRNWLDVGCGPGLVTRLAARRRYRSLGVDSDSDMVTQAEKLTLPYESTARFLCGTVDYKHPEASDYDVVSAASLLTVLPDRRQALQQLFSHVAPKGQLLIVETSARMTFINALHWCWQRRFPKGFGWLLLWGWVRGGRAVQARELAVPGCQTRCVELMDGLVNAWIIEREALGQPRSR